MAYVVVAWPRAGRMTAQRIDFRQEAHDLFTRLMHERIATSVMTTLVEEHQRAHAEEGGEPKDYAEWAGARFDKVWQVPTCNAIVFDGERVTEEQAHLVRVAGDVQRMVATRREDGTFKRVVGVGEKGPDGLHPLRFDS
jgi:hypothetical protein